MTRTEPPNGGAAAQPRPAGARRGFAARPGYLGPGIHVQAGGSLVGAALGDGRPADRERGPGGAGGAGAAPERPGTRMEGGDVRGKRGRLGYLMAG